MRARSCSVSRDVAGGGGRIHDVGNEGPEGRGAVADRLHASKDRLPGNGVAAPRAAVSAAPVLQQAGEAVERVGKFRFACQARFEFIPQGTKLGLEITGSRAKRRSAAASSRARVLPARRRRREVLPASISSEVVHEQHLDRVRHAGALRRVLAEHNRHRREVPGVFGAILETRAVDSAVRRKTALSRSISLRKAICCSRRWSCLLVSFSRCRRHA